MVDAQQMKKELQVALSSRKPQQIAQVFRRLPPLGARRRATSQHPQLQLHVDDVDWSSVLVAWVDVCEAAESGDATLCYQHQSTLHQSFHQIFSNSSGNWLVPALVVICKNTHRTARRADAGSGQHDTLQKAVTLLQESFSKTFNDRKELQSYGTPLNDDDGSKKVGVLPIVNELFASYFCLHTLRLCKNLVRPVEQRKLHLQKGPLSELVTYRYYVGRLNLFEDQFAAAEQQLESSFRYCHPNATKNQQRILRYLIPVKLYRGRLPSPELLQKYELHEFMELSKSIRIGDLRMFNDAIVHHQGRFIRQGTYLLLEKCKTVCYRNLFKRIHYITEKPQLQLPVIASVLDWLGTPMDLDEVECILANLIFQGYIRGYLSHAKRVLVLSKRDPFPVGAVIAK